MLAGNQAYAEQLKEIIVRLKKISRVSVFVEADSEMEKGAKLCGADRGELYTESYAAQYPQQAIEKFIIAAKTAQEVGLGLNAGHDLNLENLRYFQENIPCFVYKCKT